MSSLKDALKNAGFTSSKTQNERGNTRGKVMTKSEKNQFSRNFCEVCERTLPDVERYKHRNPTVDAQWICVGCADENMIEDRFRVTAQSDFAKSKRFKRFYGETISLDVNANNTGGSLRGPNRNADGNRKNHSQNNRPNQNHKHKKFNKGGNGNRDGNRDDDNFGNR